MLLQIIKFIVSKYSNSSDQCIIQRYNLNYMFRAKWPSKDITKETLPSFLLGHANQFSREFSSIFPKHMPMQREIIGKK